MKNVQILLSDLNKTDLFSYIRQNLQVLATEMFKVFSGTSPMIFSNLFHHKATSSFSLPQYLKFTIPVVDPVYCGAESNSSLFKN